MNTKARKRHLQAVRNAIRERTGTVVDLLDAARRAGESVGEREVHQLRVATRRAGAAIAAFEDLLRPKRVRRMRRRLRAVRRAAGDVRRCDVLGPMFADRQDAPEGVVGFVLARIAERRAEAIEALGRACAKESRRRLERAARKLLRKISVPEADRAADGAPEADETNRPEEPSSVIARVTDSLRAQPLDGASSFEDLHEFRLRAKRVRYAIEVFEPLFDAEAYRRASEAIIAVQDRLGAMSDRHDAMAWLEWCWERAGAGGEAAAAPSIIEGLTSLAAEYRADRDRLRDEFLDWWGASGREAIFGALEALCPASAAARGAPAPGDDGSACVGDAPGPLGFAGSDFAEPEQDEASPGAPVIRVASASPRAAAGVPA